MTSRIVPASSGMQRRTPRSTPRGPSRNCSRRRRRRIHRDPEQRCLQRLVWICARDHRCHEPIVGAGDLAGSDCGEKTRTNNGRLPRARRSDDHQSPRALVVRRESRPVRRPVAADRRTGRCRFGRRSAARGMGYRWSPMTALFARAAKAFVGTGDVRRTRRRSRTCRTDPSTLLWPRRRRCGLEGPVVPPGDVTGPLRVGGRAAHRRSSCRRRATRRSSIVDDDTEAEDVGRRCQRVTSQLLRRA